MTRRPWQTTFTVLALFVASVVLTGCPKKPAPQAGTGPGGGDWEAWPITVNSSSKNITTTRVSRFFRPGAMVSK